MLKFDKRNRLIIVVALLVVSVLGFGAFKLTRGESENGQNVLSQQVDFTDPNTEAVVAYPESARVHELSEKDKQDNISLRLTHEEGQTPYLITLRSETGLKAVAALTKMEMVDMIMANSEKALPQRFSGYQKVSSRRFEQNGRKAGEIIFTYDSPVEGERIKQRFVVLAKDENTAMYLAMQSKDSDFEKLNPEVFRPTADSLGFR